VETALGDFFAGRGLDPRQPALVGFSGGPDSTALLIGLHAIGAGPLRAVHVDHGMRPEAERVAELAIVTRLCSSLGIGLTVAHIAPGAIETRARDKGEGIEAAARAYRYHVFRKLLGRGGAGRLYLAHTRDDQLETLLMRAFSGSSSAGLRGMAAISGPFCRPLLGLGKAELLSYLEERGVGYSLDSTNSGEDYLRNRLRHGVIPRLDEAFPAWSAGLLATAAKAAEDEEALAAWAGRSGFRPGEGAKALRAPASLLGEPAAVRRRAFLSAASGLLPGRRISSRLADAAFKALGKGARRYVGGGLELAREGESLSLGLALDFPRDDGYFVMIGGPVNEPFSLGIGRVRVEALWIFQDNAMGKAQTSCGIREGAFSFPLIVRSRRPGDALPIRGGNKPLDDLFSEWGILAALRTRIPVIEDRDGIVAVLGSGFGYRDRFRPCGAIDSQSVGDGNGRVLCIKVKGA
jgi:tRNA(Ile)-lysidine synthase